MYQISMYYFNADWVSQLFVKIEILIIRYNTYTTNRCCSSLRAFAAWNKLSPYSSGIFFVCSECLSDFTYVVGWNRFFRELPLTIGFLLKLPACFLIVYHFLCLDLDWRPRSLQLSEPGLFRRKNVKHYVIWFLCSDQHL